MQKLKSRRVRHTDDDDYPWHGILVDVMDTAYELVGPILLRRDDVKVFLEDDPKIVKLHGWWVFVLLVAREENRAALLAYNLAHNIRPESLNTRRLVVDAANIANVRARGLQAGSEEMVRALMQSFS